MKGLYRTLLIGSLALAAFSGGIANNRWVDVYTSTREWMNRRSAIVQLQDAQQMGQRLQMMHEETQQQIAELSSRPAAAAHERAALPVSTSTPDNHAAKAKSTPLPEKRPALAKHSTSAAPETRTENKQLDSVVSQYFAIQNDPYTVKNWSHNKDHAWYSVMSQPGQVYQGKWVMPATIVESAQGQDKLRFTLNTALRDNGLVFRLLFSKNNSIVGSAYCRPGSVTELLLSKDLYVSPVQYELARQNADKTLDILASGRNLYFNATQQNKPNPPVAEDGQRYHKTDKGMNDARGLAPAVKADLSPLQHRETASAISYLPVKMPSLTELAALKQRHTDYLSSGNCTAAERQSCMYNIQFMEAAMRGKQA